MIAQTKLKKRSGVAEIFPKRHTQKGNMNNEKERKSLILE